MRSNFRVALVFSLLGALLVGWILWGKRHLPAASTATVASASELGASPGAMVLDPLQAVPDGALLVTTVDLRAVRQTALGDRLIGKGRRIPGLGLLTEVCGADPMQGVDKLAIAVPARAADADFGLVGTGRIDADSLLRCAEKVITGRGGQPVISPAGSFRVLRDATATEAHAELAVGSSGLVMLSQGSYLQASIDAAEGRLPNIIRSEEHASLRRLVRSGAVVATIVLTPELRQTLAQELASQGTPDSPFASVTAAAASLSLGDEIGFELVLQCDSAAASSSATSMLERLAADRGQALASSAPELATLIGELRFRAQGSAVHVELAIAADRALLALDALLTR